MQALLLLSEGGEGPNLELLWLLGILLGFFALVVIVGWVAALRKPEQAPVMTEAGPVPVKKKAGDDLVEPKTSQKKSKGGLKKK